MKPKRNLIGTKGFSSRCLGNFLIALLPREKKWQDREKSDLHEKTRSAFDPVAGFGGVVRAGIEPATHGFSVNEKTENSTEKTPDSGQGTAHLQRRESGSERNGELASAGTDQSPVTQTVLNYIAERLTVLEKRRWTA